jgi:hypothetical protein
MASDKIHCVELGEVFLWTLTKIRMKWFSSIAREPSSYIVKIGLEIPAKKKQRIGEEHSDLAWERNMQKKLCFM